MKHHRHFFGILLSLGLFGQSACKLEPIDRLAPSDPTALGWKNSSVVIPDQRPQSEAARELAKTLTKTYEELSGLSGQAPLPDSKPPLIRFLTDRFGKAMLAPDGDNRGWTQAVPLRSLENTAWNISVSMTPHRNPRRLRRRSVDPKTIEVDESSADWVFRQFRDTGGAQETFSLLRVTAAQLESKQKLNARGKYVLLDATQSDHAKLRAQLLEPGSKWLAALGAAGAVGCSVFTSLNAEDSLWLQLGTTFKRPFTELLAPGEAPPSRIEALAIANAKASRVWQAWHGGQVRELGPERAGQGPQAVGPVSPASPVERRGQIVISMSGKAKWQTRYSVLGRQPGVIRPEKAIVVLARWRPSAKEPAEIDHKRSDPALTALLGLMQRTFAWREQGRRSDISILYGALYGGPDARDAGIAQFLRQKTVRPENIRAVIWLEDFSTRHDALDVAVRSNELPEGWPQLLELYGGHHLQISTPTPLADDDPLATLQELKVPVLTFTQAPWLQEAKAGDPAARTGFMPMAELIEKLLQFTWTLTEQEPIAGAAASAEQSP